MSIALIILGVLLVIFAVCCAIGTGLGKVGLSYPLADDEPDSTSPERVA